MRFVPLPLVAAVAVALPYTSVFAENQPAKSDVQQAEQDVERITVTGKYTIDQTIDTATGLGLSLRETPQSVSVLTADRLRDQDLSTLLDAVNNGIGVSASEIDNVRNTFEARGFEITNYQIDGVPLSWSLAGDSGETITDVSIYERVEFVRGATGLLTGAGDPSASINLVRKHADSTELTGYVDVAGGSWDKKQITADVSSGLNSSGSLRGRVVAKYLNGDSFTDNYEDNKTVLYGVIEADLSPTTLLRLGASYQHSDPKGAVWGALPALDSNGSTIHWDDSTTTAPDWTRWETTNTNYFVNINHTFSNGWQLLVNYNRLEYESDTRLLYVYGQTDLTTGAGLSAQRYRSYGETDQDSFDFQLKGQYQLFERDHDFVFGALYSSQDSWANSYAPISDIHCIPNPPEDAYDCIPIDNFFQGVNGIEEPGWSNTPTPGEDMTTRQKGVYAATRLSLTDRLNAVIGGRISSWQRRGISYGTTTDFGDDGEFVPYAGVLYDLTAQHRVYASYTEIFNPQNAKDANGHFIDPLEGKNYEIGLKSTFLNDRLHTTLALFKVDQDNFGINTGSFQDNDRHEAIYYASQLESNGVELEVVGEPLSGWNISAGYSQYSLDVKRPINGNRSRTDRPRKQFKLFTTYQFVDWLPQLTVGGGVNWHDKTYAMGSSSKLTQGSYAITNLMGRYEITDSLSLQANINNLFDKRYYNYLVASSDAYTMYRYGEPRNATVSITYKF